MKVRVRGLKRLSAVLSNRGQIKDTEGLRDHRASCCSETGKVASPPYQFHIRCILDFTS